MMVVFHLGVSCIAGRYRVAVVVGCDCGDAGGSTLELWCLFLSLSFTYQKVHLPLEGPQIYS